VFLLCAGARSHGPAHRWPVVGGKLPKIHEPEMVRHTMMRQHNGQSEHCALRATPGDANPTLTTLSCDGPPPAPLFAVLRCAVAVRERASCGAGCFCVRVVSCAGSATRPSNTSLPVCAACVISGRGDLSGVQGTGSNQRRPTPWQSAGRRIPEMRDACRCKGCRRAAAAHDDETTQRTIRALCSEGDAR
jgi:hypothetical protein